MPSGSCPAGALEQGGVAEASDAVTRHTRLHAHVCTLCAHTAHTHALLFPRHPSSYPQRHTPGRVPEMCAVGTGLAEADPAETQGNFWHQSPHRQPGHSLGWAARIGDLGGSLGLGKVWRAGGLGPALGSTLPYPRGAGVSALGALLPSEEEGEGYGTSTSQVWRPQASCPPAMGVLIRMGGRSHWIPTACACAQTLQHPDICYIFQGAGRSPPASQEPAGCR